MSEKKLHIIVARPGYAELLQEELAERWHTPATVVSNAAVALEEKARIPAPGETVFARQVLPWAVQHLGADVEAAVKFIVKRLEVMTKRGNRQSGAWTLHVYAIDDDPAVARGLALEKALRTAVKASLPAFSARFVEPQAVEGDLLVVQVYLPSMDDLWLSAATIGSGVSPYVGGIRRMRHRAGAPSRSARKLEEAFVVLDREPRVGELAVDLGAAPGGWSFLLASFGADVQAIDHAELDLPALKRGAGRIEHLKENGLKYFPSQPVDWLCCDMVMASRESLKVLERWLEKKWMRHFVVNVKFPTQDAGVIVREALALLARHETRGATLKAKHLYHDRREITLMGRDLFA